MKLTLHLVWNELRRLRGWVIAAILISAIQPIVGFWLTAGGNLAEGDWSNAGRIAAMANYLRAVFVYVLTIVLVQNDSLMGTKQFWATRPISWTRLLLAKMITGAVVFSILPGIVSLPWQVWCGFGATEILSAAGEHLVPLALIAIPAALIASVTDSLARALLWTPVLYAVLASAVGGFGSAIEPLRERVLIFAVMVVWATSAGAVVLRYGRRHRPWETLIGCILMIMLVSMLLRTVGVRLPEFEPRAWRAHVADGVSLEFARAERRIDARVNRRPRNETSDSISVSLRARGVPNGFELHAIGVRSSWLAGASFTGQGEVASVAPSHELLGFKWPRPDPESTAHHAAKFLERFGRPMPTYAPHDDDSAVRRVMASASFSGRESDEMAKQPVTYEARFWMACVRPEIGLELALSDRRWARGRGVSGRTLDNADVIRVLTATHTPVRAQIERVFMAIGRSRDLNREYFLHRGRGEFISASRVRNRTLSLAGAELRVSDYAKPNLTVIRDGKPVPRDPIQDWSFAVVNYEVESRFSRSFRQERVTIADVPVPRPAASATKP